MDEAAEEIERLARAILSLAGAASRIAAALQDAALPVQERHRAPPLARAAAPGPVHENEVRRPAPFVVDVPRAPVLLVAREVRPGARVQPTLALPDRRYLV